MLSCISLDRYLSIVHAVQMYSRKKPMVTHCCCLMVWLFCLLLSIPDWIFLTDNKDSRRQYKTECVPYYPSVSWDLAARWLYHFLGFLLPALIMLFCYSCILLRVRRGSQCKQKKRAIRVIIALVVAFFIHWTPYNITLIVDTIQTNATNNTINQTSCENITSLDVAITATSTLAYLHCCVNPVLYAFVGVKFRQHLLDMLRPLGFTLKVPAGLVSRKSSVWSDSVDTSHTSAFWNIVCSHTDTCTISQHVIFSFYANFKICISQKSLALSMQALLFTPRMITIFLIIIIMIWEDGSPHHQW